jgi:hypothetical protein
MLYLRSYVTASKKLIKVNNILTLKNLFHKLLQVKYMKSKNILLLEGEQGVQIKSLKIFQCKRLNKF